MRQKKRNARLWAIGMIDYIFGMASFAAMLYYGCHCGNVGAFWAGAITGIGFLLGGNMMFCLVRDFPERPDWCEYTEKGDEQDG